MTNKFDFELVADDRVSDALNKIDARVKALQPELDKTRDGLNLGGQQTQDQLGNVNRSFEMLGRFAKDNVQFIGDMVPPLRNFTGMASRIGGMAGKFGLAGGAAYLAGKGVAGMAGDMSDAASNAYDLQVAAENAGMSVKDFTQLSGAMRLLGSDSESARGSVEGLFKSFNDAVQGRNNAVLAVMNQIHAPIIKNADGTADVLQTMQQLAAVFPKLAPQNQKTVADALGLDANGLQLLREGAHLKELLTKSDAVGLTVDPKINQQLVSFNRTLNEASASWDGFKLRMQQKFTVKLLSDGSVKSGIEGITDVLEHGANAISVGHALGLNTGSDADMMRRAQQDKAFQATLTPFEKRRLDWGIMTEKDRQKYRIHYGLSDQASSLQDDMKIISQPPTQNSQMPAPNGITNPNALSVINNNPWNIRYAGQANATPGAKDFARFNSGEAGVTGADKQLMLYYTGQSRNVDHPLRTLSEIISKASPRSDGNDTPQMIQDASRELGVNPNQPLDLSDVGMRSRVLAALFNREGNNPYSASQIQSILQQQSGPDPAMPNPAPVMPNPDPAMPNPAPVMPHPVPAMPNPAPVIPGTDPAMPNPTPVISSTGPSMPNPSPVMPNLVPAMPNPPPVSTVSTPAPPVVTVAPVMDKTSPPAPAPAPVIPAPVTAAPSIVTPYRPPVPQNDQQAAGASPESLADALSTALKEQGMKIELTLINGKNGQRQTFTGTGAKISTAMQFPS